MAPNWVGGASSGGSDNSFNSIVLDEANRDTIIERNAAGVVAISTQVGTGDGKLSVSGITVPNGDPVAITINDNGDVSLSRKLTVTGTYNASSGTEYGAVFNLDFSGQTGSAGYTALYLNTLDGVGSGTRKLIELRNNSKSRFYVLNNGTGYLYGGLLTGVITGSSPTDGVTIRPGDGGTDSPNTKVTLGTRTYTAANGSFVAVNINPTYNQTSGTASNTDLLVSRTETAIGSGAQYLINAKVNSVDRFSVSNRGVVSSNLVINTDSDTDEIDSVAWGGGYGILIACSETDVTSAIWKLEGTGFTAVSVDADWTNTKDNAGTYNVYFETGALKLQNKVGDNKVLKIGFYGV